MSAQQRVRARHVSYIHPFFASSLALSFPGWVERAHLARWGGSTAHVHWGYSLQVRRIPSPCVSAKRSCLCGRCGGSISATDLDLLFPA